MKNRVVHLTILAVMVFSLTGLLQGQMAIKENLARVDVPFAFFAGGTHLLAGNYHISHPGDPYFVLIEKDDGRARALVYVQSSAVNLNGSTKLVFNKYGDQYFLSQIWTEPDQDVHQCSRNAREKRTDGKESEGGVSGYCCKVVTAGAVFSGARGQAIFVSIPRA